MAASSSFAVQIRYPDGHGLRRGILAETVVASDVNVMGG